MEQNELEKLTQENQTLKRLLAAATCDCGRPYIPEPQQHSSDCAYRETMRHNGMWHSVRIEDEAWQPNP